MKIEFIEARDLPDAWFQCVYRILDSGYEYQIETFCCQRGSKCSSDSF